MRLSLFASAAVVFAAASFTSVGPSSAEIIDNSAILDAVAAMPITTWEYKNRADARHIGPMAQDFYAAFGLGDSERHISAVDAAGVSLAAIQALSQQLEDKDAELEALKERLAALESLLLGE